MPRESAAVKGRLTYAEVADTLDFKQLEQDLFSRVRFFVIALVVIVMVAVGLFVFIFGLNLSDMDEAIVEVVGFAILIAVGFYETHMEKKSVPSVRAYLAVVREEWKTGERILPEWFRVPTVYQRMRAAPELSEAQLRSLRFANKVDSKANLVLLRTIIFVAFVVDLILAFTKSPVWVIVAILAVPSVILFAPWIVAYPDIRLLRQLRHYEEVSGKDILPDELRKREKGDVRARGNT